VIILEICDEHSCPAILRLVVRRIFQLAASLVLILATVTPLMEVFDHWDKNVVPANDTELRVTAWFVCAGLVLTVAKLLRYVPALRGSKRYSGQLFQAPAALRLDAIASPAPTGSPPSLIPLRI